MLFVFMLGGLTLALNKAASLWNSAHTRQNEEEQAELVLNMMTDDLRQAVADTGSPVINSHKMKPSFLCDASTNRTDKVVPLLQFVKLRPERSSFNTNESKPPFLDAVIYTYYGNMLFRHIAPLEEYNDTSKPALIGQLLESLKDKIVRESIHDEIIDYMNALAKTSKPEKHPGNYSVIASFIEQPLILGCIRRDAVTNDGKTDTPVVTEQTDSLDIITPPLYCKFATRALPDYLDIEIRIFNEVEWNTYLQLSETASAKEFNRKNPFLGKYRSKRIYLPAAGAAELP
ncbi:MAG: hypothetical protein R6V06_05320 [Kiritimatiellia bacterium]